MKINCLGCGFKVDLAGAYDDYEGQIKCFACGAIMEIATREGEDPSSQVRGGVDVRFGRGF